MRKDGRATSFEIQQSRLLRRREASAQLRGQGGAEQYVLKGPARGGTSSGRFREWEQK
jgi:hypothetical protein